MHRLGIWTGKKSVPGISLMASISQSEHNADLVLFGRDERHTIFARWIAEELLDSKEGLAGRVIGGKGRVIDAAGGKGRLSDALVRRGLRSALVDPCAGTGRDHGEAGFFVDIPISLENQPDLLCQSCEIGANEGGHTDEEVPLLVFRETLQQCMRKQPALMRDCIAIVGLHPDEATEDTVDAALSRQIPFAVVPCCVLFKLFPGRRLASSGTCVKKVGAFIEYLRDKDYRMQVTSLPFAGRNQVVFMRAQDYLLPVKKKQPPNYWPCASAAKSGDLQKLKELRSGAHPSPWNWECAQKAAWAGHLEVLQWMRANGCEWDHSCAVAAATKGKQQHVLQWLQETLQQNQQGSGGGDGPSTDLLRRLRLNESEKKQKEEEEEEEEEAHDTTSLL
jgi:hypothetical protein